MAELLDHEGLYKFADELVRGSIDPVRALHKSTRQSIITAYGEIPNAEQQQAIEKLFPWDTPDRYDIGPYGVKVTINDGGDQRTLGLGEFITGVAVACGKESTVKEVETVIYHVGALMGKLE